MQMTNAEILHSFRTAAKPAAQVEILAELNGVPVEKIKKILVDEGVDPRQLPRAKKNMKKEEPVKVKKSPGSSVVTSLETEIKRLDKRTEEIKRLIIDLQEELEANLKKMKALDEAWELLQDAYE